MTRLYAIVDTAILSRRGGDPVEVAGAMIDAGVKLLQFRHKGHYTRAVYQQTQAIAGLCTAAQASFVIDDRADIARLLSAGVHLGQDDLPPADARRIVGVDALVGFSTHNAEQLENAAAEPVDYLAIGPVFVTVSKENPDPVLGLDTIAALRRLTSKPLVAIGGITRANARLLWDAGVDSVAVISDLLPETLNADAIRRRAEEWLLLAEDML